MSQVARHVWTYEELRHLPEDGQRHEIIDGEHQVTPAPSLRHQRIAMRLSAALHGFASAHGIGHVYAAPVDVCLRQATVVQPDILLLCAERAHLAEEDRLAGPPDLVVEITSPTSRQRDLLTKRALYEDAGVEEYWVVDPEPGRVTVFRRRGQGYGPEATFGRGSTLTTPLLPGFELSLEAIFDE